MSFVHDGNDTYPAANELVPRDLVDLETSRRWRDVVDRDVEGAYPSEGELGLENGGVGAFLGTLTEGCSGVI